MFLTESGACQIIVQSRKPEAARLRKQICDLFVADGEAWVVRHLDIAKIEADLTEIDAQLSAPPKPAAAEHRPG